MIEVRDIQISQVHFAFDRHIDQVNAATRGVHLLAPQSVGGAGLQAKAAMDAGVQKLRGWGMVVVENLSGAGRRRRELLNHMPPTKRPGFRVCPGSNFCLIRCISGSTSFTVPHTSSSSFMATGHCDTVIVPSRRSTP